MKIIKEINIIIKTKNKNEIIDLTEKINSYLKNLEEVNFCYIFLTHTTCALTTADLDPGTDLDMLDAFNLMIPKLNYRHPHNPNHVKDHILSSLIKTELLLPCKNKELILGTWQRVILIEFDGPRERNIILRFF